MQSVTTNNVTVVLRVPLGEQWLLRFDTRMPQACISKMVGYYSRLLRSFRHTKVSRIGQVSFFDGPH